jgi:hypothetical protein
VPCFDYLGFKSGFSIDKPWLYQDFDLLNFYRVTEDELNEKLLLFRSGRYKFEWEDVEFDMAEHNKFLAETADEVKEIRAKQREAQKKMIQAEKDSLAKWREEREKYKVDENIVETLLAGKSIRSSSTESRANHSTIQIRKFHRSRLPSMPTCGRSWSKKVKKSDQTTWSQSSKQ